VKLIAEPWDVGEGDYQVGNFPPLWSEWNGKHRDCVRDFWRGEGFLKRESYAFEFPLPQPYPMQTLLNDSKKLIRDRLPSQRELVPSLARESKLTNSSAEY